MQTSAISQGGDLLLPESACPRNPSIQTDRKKCERRSRSRFVLLTPVSAAGLGSVSELYRSKERQYATNRSGRGAGQDEPDKYAQHVCEPSGFSRNSLGANSEGDVIEVAAQRGQALWIMRAGADARNL